MHKEYKMEHNERRQTDEIWSEKEAEGNVWHI
jgi:hypothetical protein